jgi:tetratricopeptide (TPR) repeat protein
LQLTAALLAVRLSASPLAAQVAPPADAAKSEPNADQAAGAKQCFQRAEADYFAGRLAEARRGFECAYVQLPSAELAWNLARVNERMGDVEEGLRYFREYLELAQPPREERKRVEKRIAALVKLGERQGGALKPGRDVNRAMGHEARTFFNRGTKLYRGGHYPAAAAAFTAALQLSAAPELHYNLGVTAERMLQLEDACDHYKAYLEAWPEAPDRGRVQAHIGVLRGQLNATGASAAEVTEAKRD